MLLHNVLTSAVDHLHLSAETWGTTWRELILPVLNELASTMQEQAANREDTRPLARTLCLAVNVTHKTFVLHLRELSGLREWRALWLSTLQVCVVCPLATRCPSVRGGLRPPVALLLGGGQLLVLQAFPHVAAIVVS